MTNIPLQKKIAVILSKDSSYPKDAYQLITDVIHAASKEQHSSQKQSHHIGAKKIVQSVIDYAIKEYGFFASEVLVKLNLINAIDVGKVVFNLIEVELLHQSEDDSLSDFDYDCNIIQALTQHQKNYTVRSDQIKFLG
ncbi:Minf_1886 family protein [Lentisphaerota bacterium WC36G]|nr:hypothetical protein LJT99_00560 [Lentisphaerae bacterium WC36]